jgi:predicted ATPase
MLKSLKIKNFTVFSEAEIELSPGLNMVIGENNTGKSHLLKLAYVIASIWYEAAAENEKTPGEITSGGSKSWWQRRLAEKLVGVFKPDKLGHLLHRESGRQKAEIEAEMSTNCSLKFALTAKSQKKVEILETPTEFPPALPIFLPTKEVLSLYPGFVKLYDERELSIDETYSDLCRALNGFLLKGQKAKNIAAFLEPLETILCGQLRLKDGRFYLKPTGKKEMEISLVAEGLRKIATLAYLVANGSLSQQNLLFWDEPDADLNAKILTKLAHSLVELVEKSEVQVILATHSFFLMKELSVLVEVSKGKIPAQFLSLAQGKKGIEVGQGDLLEYVPTITVLDEIIAQDDRVQQLFYEGQI